MANVTNTIHISGEPDAIFDFVTTARHWTRWHPATLRVSGQIEQPMRAGDIIREHARIGGMDAENDWKVTQLERPQRVVLSMPKTRLGDLKISYTFEPRGDGIEFVRSLEYDTAGVAAELAARIERQMVQDSEEAVRRLKGIVEQSGKEG